MKNIFRVTVLAGCVSAMFTSAPATAQTPPKGSDDPLALEKIVVTAQKRQQAVQDVPISITVLGEEALTKARITTLYDINQLAPNFEAVPAPGTSAVTIRGVGGGGRNIGFDTRVGIYIDGIYVGQAQAIGQPLFDIEQVEILRGPQGHLFGRNTVAGAVSITTRAPTKDFEGSIRAVVGNYGAREAYGTFAGPITDQVLGKLSVATEKRDGYATNLFNNQKLNDLKRLTTRGQLVFLVSDKLKINVNADYSDTSQNIILGEPTTSFSDRPFRTGPLPHGVVNFNTTPYINNDISGISMTANYVMDGGNTFTSVTGYRHTHQDRANDTDYSPQDILSINYVDDFKQSSQEFRITSPGNNKARYVVGAYYLGEAADTVRVASSGVDAGLIRQPAGLRGINAGTVTTKTYALFSALDYDMTSALTLNLGARYTKEKKDFFYNLHGGATLGITTLDNYTDNRTENKVTPMIGATLALSKDTNIYAKYSTGFKSGGWNADFVRASQVADGLAFNTETVKSFELGLKGKLLGGRMQYDLSAFNSNFDNYQTFFFVPLPNGTAILQLKNAAQVESRGIEASTRVRATQNLSFGLNLGILKTTYKSFPNGGGIGVDLSGQSVPDTPELTGALTLDYGIPMPSLGGRFDFYTDYGHRKGTFQGTGLAPFDARNLVNARFGFTTNDTKWNLSLWGRNLTKQDYIIATGRDFLGNNFVTRGQPRTYGIETKYNF